MDDGVEASFQSQERVVDARPEPEAMLQRSWRGLAHVGGFKARQATCGAGTDRCTAASFKVGQAACGAGTKGYAAAVVAGVSVFVGRHRKGRVCGMLSAS